VRPSNQPSVKPKSAPFTALWEAMAGLEPAVGWVGVVESEQAVRSAAESSALPRRRRIGIGVPEEEAEAD
jgi:hypothetical protein